MRRKAGSCSSGLAQLAFFMQTLKMQLHAPRNRGHGVVPQQFRRLPAGKRMAPMDVAACLIAGRGFEKALYAFAQALLIAGPPDEALLLQISESVAIIADGCNKARSLAPGAEGGQGMAPQQSGKVVAAGPFFE